MTRHSLLCLGTSPNPKVRKLLKGGVENGPKIHPASQIYLFIYLFCQASELWSIITNHKAML